MAASHPPNKGPSSIERLPPARKMWGIKLTEKDGILKELLVVTDLINLRPSPCDDSHMTARQRSILCM